MKRILTITLAISGLMTIANAQNYAHKRVVMGACGGMASAEGVTSRGIFGQTAAGVVSDGGYTNYAGFFFPYEWMTFSDGEDQLPLEFGLNQNYPNPFNPSTSIEYTLPSDSNVRLEVYNILGQRVEVLVDAHQDAGHYSYTWHAGLRPSGIYFYRIVAGDDQKTRKMVVLK